LRILNEELLKKNDSQENMDKYEIELLNNKIKDMQKQNVELMEKEKNTEEIARQYEEIKEKHENLKN